MKKLTLALVLILVASVGIIGTMKGKTEKASPSPIPSAPVGPTSTPTPSPLPPSPTPHPPTPTPKPATPTPKPETPTPSGPSVLVEKWIEIDLSEQTLKCWEGEKEVCSFLVSTGLAHTPTPTGSFTIHSKATYVNMGCNSSRYDYCLPKVPFVMGFFKDYTIHGTYWHNDFGRPRSHGCVNLETSNAKWVFLWAPLGTKVIISP